MKLTKEFLENETIENLTSIVVDLEWITMGSTHDEELFLEEMGYYQILEELKRRNKGETW